MAGQGQRIQRARAAGSQPDPHRSRPREAGLPLSSARVLCVDNEESILIGMRSLLTRWGCEVWTATDQAQCAALLADGVRPQLALVDYHLDHGETGTELMGWLRTQLAEPIPGVVISADGRPEMVAQVHYGGGWDYPGQTGEAGGVARLAQPASAPLISHLFGQVRHPVEVGHCPLQQVGGQAFAGAGAEQP